MSLPPEGGPSNSVGTPLRIVVADGHGLMRRGLRMLLDAEAGFDVVGEADRLGAAERQVCRHRPDVLVIALHMTNGSSSETIGRLRRQAPGTEIVALTTDESAVLAERALDSGALGFVMTDHAECELPQALRAVARGERYVSAVAAERLQALRRSRARAPRPEPQM